MCGIVGYVGSKPGLEVVLEGLRRLEYRGYDSAGVAVLDDGQLRVERRAGKLANLEKRLVELDGSLPGSLAVGHTRWATHGPPTDGNAHPHLDCSGAVAVVHNGTIENFEALVAGLEARGHERRSDTDTEVVAHLLEERYGDGPTKGDLAASLRSVCRDLEGSFVLVVAHRDEPDLVVAARRNLPLVIGLGEGENFVGSDVTAFIAHTREARAVDQDQVVEVRRSGVVVTDLAGTVVPGESYHVDWDTAAAEKGGYEYFMLKEIAEQPQAVRDTLGGRLTPEGLVHLDELSMSDEDLRGIEQVFIVACGSSYHSGLIGKYAIERWCRLPVQVEMASEFRYRDPVLGRNTLVIAISQSGETADTLEAVRHARSQRAWVLAVTNTLGSTISRESDAALYTRAGPEVAVASTKAVIAQITAMYLVGLYLSGIRGHPRRGRGARAPGRPAGHPGPARRAAHPDGAGPRAGPLDRGRPAGAVPGPARGLPDRPGGRAQAQGAGVRLGGGLPGGRDQARADRPGRAGHAGRGHRHPPRAAGEAAQQRAGGAGPRRPDHRAGDRRRRQRRGARRRLLRIPDTKTLLAPLLTIVPLQVLSAEVAIARGLDVDQPRNLAKSVTVE